MEAADTESVESKKQGTSFVSCRVNCNEVSIYEREYLCILFV